MQASVGAKRMKAWEPTSNKKSRNTLVLYSSSSIGCRVKEQTAALKHFKATSAFLLNHAEQNSGNTCSTNLILPEASAGGIIAGR